MIGDPIILAPVGADFVATHSAPNLLATDIIPSLSCSSLFCFGKFGRKNLKGHRAALVLGAHIYPYAQARELVCDDNTALHLVAILPARSADLHIRIVELEAQLGVRIQYGYRHRRRLHSSPFFGGWDALDSMAARFVPEEPFGSGAGEEDRDKSRSFVYEFSFKDPSAPQPSRRPRGGL